MGAAATPLPVPRQIIDGDGVFDIAGLNRFVKDSRLADCGVSYTVVSIMGPQSSGKSTLLNHLFRTSFREMNSDEGRSQTTNGIWLAKAAGIQPCTLVMDLEGNDGRERGEDDTSFERQSALFALAVSDVVLINMWCHDVGREQASNKPLLRTVFQVMARLFTPRKITLLFVIRDKTRSPLEKLESTLRHDIRKIWDSVASSGARQGAALSEFFDLQVVALPNFEEKEEQFTEEVAGLRERFSYSSTPGGLVQDRGAKVHASGFSFNAKQIWNLIKEEKDLDLPSISVMVSTIRCEEIAQKKFDAFLKNEEWRRLEMSARSGPVCGFGKELTSIIDACLSGFGKEAIHFDEGARTLKQRDLSEKLLVLVQPAFRSALGHLRSRTLGNFKRAFDKGLSRGDGFSSAANECFQEALNCFDLDCLDAMVEQAKWDVSKERGELMDDMRTHITSQQAEKLAKLIDTCKTNLCDELCGPVENLLKNANDETWSSIRVLLRRVTKSVVSTFTSVINGFDIDERTKRDMLTVLQDYATGVVESKAREVAKKVSILMKERFLKSFFPDSSSMRRILMGKENFQAITHAASCASLETLAAMAAVRLVNKDDNIKRKLSAALLTNHNYSTSATGFTDTALGSLVSDKWDGIPPSRALITPVQCESLWRQLIHDNKSVVNQAFSVQVKVASMLCEEISNKMFLTFSKDEDWLMIKKAARKGAVPDFGAKISSMIRACLHRYEMETKDSDKATRLSKQTQLGEKLLHLVRPSFQYVLGHMRCDTFYNFQEAFEKTLQSGKGFPSAAKYCTRHYMDLFDESCAGAFVEQAPWDTSVISEELRRDMDAHVAYVQERKVRELVKAFRGKLNDTLTGPVEILLDGANDETWSSIRNLLHRETDSRLSDFSIALADFEMDVGTSQRMLASLRDHAKGVVEEKAREVARRVSLLMKDRFSRWFFLDENSMLRDWSGKEDVVAITQAARSASLKMLSVMAAVRLEDYRSDNIEGTLSAALLQDHVATDTNVLGSLASETWEEVPPERTLLTPLQCKFRWGQFIEETESMVARAILSPA